MRRKSHRMITVAVFGLLLLVWYAVTSLRLVAPLFLPSPWEVIDAGYRLFAENSFAYDVLVSTFRVIVGFGLSCVFAVPLGVLIGVNPRWDAASTPLLNFIRYMPAPAFIPLLILWLGIGFSQKVALVFISIFFYLVSLVAQGITSVSQDCIDSALTLGATRHQVLWRVVVRAAAPDIWQSMRIMMGVAWTSIVVVELVAAQNGVGAMIIRAQRFLQTPRIIAGIVVIGVLGVLFDYLFRISRFVLFPWAVAEQLRNAK
jgi:NitT/TauT family transport system permease protein